MADRRAYNAGDVRAITAVSQRCLDYWDQIGLVQPSVTRKKTGSKDNRGSERLYSYEDLLKLKLVRKLRQAGLSLQKIQKAVQKLRRRQRTSDPLLEVLITDGKTVERVRSDGKVEDLLTEGQLVFAVVALGRIEEELKRAVVQLERQGQTDKKRAARAVSK
jgi:DNA-binding transcriptional MerR regulator